MARNINDETVKMSKQWEGFRAEAYPDPGSKDGTPWTIGYGQTRINGRAVKKGDKITEAEAAKAHEARLVVTAAQVEKLVKVKLSDNQFGALVIFADNIGLSAFEKSTLLKKLNAGDYASVPAELARWVYNDGKRMQGLANRRAAEAGLWARGEFVTSAPVDAAPGAPPIDRETLTWGAGILASLGAVFSGEGPVQWALAAVIIVAFGVAGFLWLKKRVNPK